MEAIIKKASSFIGGLFTIMMAILPVTILWTVLTGTSVFGMDVIANLTGIVNALGNGGFVGLVVLVIVWSFFDKK
jgi:Na+/H+ antiporter NhaC|tara:strand:- start:73 stop:297 length:225 start_codon:yes stop_codon:yes gene_type:complete